MAVSNFSWARADAWAGHVVYRNGKFYWYICAEHRYIPGKAIGVAVSNSPTGPFTDARGTALVTNDMTTQINSQWDDIDPAVFIDDNGQAYLFWGNTRCYWARLKSNMIELDGGINVISSSNLPNFTEAPWVHKRNGTYYLSYAYGWPEEIHYATSSSPTGSWTYRGILNDRIPNCGTNHQSIIEFNGNWYFFYHTAALSGGHEYRRSVCLDHLYYNSNGTMKKVMMTSSGIGGPSPTPLVPVTGVNYTFVNRNSGKLLEVANASTADGANVQQWTSNGHNCQKWRLESAGSGYYRIVNVNSGKLLEVQNALTSDDANVVQWPSNGHYCQQWRFAQ